MDDHGQLKLPLRHICILRDQMTASDGCPLRRLAARLLS